MPPVRPITFHYWLKFTRIRKKLNRYYNKREESINELIRTSLYISHERLHKVPFEIMSVDNSACYNGGTDSPSTHCSSSS